MKANLRFWDRHRGMRCRHQVVSDTKTDLKRLGIRALLVAAIVATILSMVSCSRTAKAEVTLSTRQSVVDNYTRLLAVAMNGGTLYDRISGTAYFFDKPTEVKLP